MIELRGVRVHNLKSIDLDLPRDRWIAISGVSGSGKSSLAFDTLYAEGQRRYIETFSPYIRQFLEKLEKPDADRIDGLPPAVAVSQRMSRRSARATVGSLTEIQDLLALLLARLGRVVCSGCGEEIRPSSSEDVLASIARLPNGTRYLIAFPVDIRPETPWGPLCDSLREDGFLRIVAEGQMIDLESAARAPAPGDSIHVVVDRLVKVDEQAGRVRDSIETSFTHGLGRCVLLCDGKARTFSRGWRCSACGQEAHAPDPRRFRPNHSLGACPRCAGFGSVMDLDMTRVVPDATRSLEQGAVALWQTAAYRDWQRRLLAWAPGEGVPIDRPFKLLDPRQVELVFEGDAKFAGVRGFVRGLERRAYKTHVRAFLSRFRNQRVCPDCQGARLRPESLLVRLGGLHAADLCSMPIRDARIFAERFAEEQSGVHGPARSRLLALFLARLRYLDEIGLGYLTLDRPARTLSAGESRRVSLAAALGSGLVNTLYVLDEPSIGLHGRDVEKLIGAIQNLRAAPNSVVVVDHEQSLLRAADHLVDIGPGAGESGGRVVYAGPPAASAHAEGSVTAAFLSGRRKIPVPRTRRKPGRTWLRLEGATGHNLKNIDVAFPLGVLCVVTGVSGAGKSTLVEDTLYPAVAKRLRGQHLAGLPYRDLRGARSLSDVVLIDDSPIGRTPRSNPVTYIKAFDEIRKTFAATHDSRLRNYGPSQFSFNVEGGRCGHCEGSGHLFVNMQFLSDVLIRCPDCKGKRFRSEILEITYRGKNIADVLEMTAREAFGFFRNRPRIQMSLRPLIDVGLDYLQLGQPANTLSGGEAQRLKLAANLTAPSIRTEAGNLLHRLYLLDEPTSGLHPADVARLVDCLNLLADRGHSFIVVEHDPDFIAAADWVIDLGPEAGAEGGRIVAEGTPETVAQTDTHTGRLLANYFDSMS